MTLSRKKNGPEGFLIAKHHTQYDEKILKSLHKLLGLKKSLNILQKCSSLLKADYKSNTGQAGYVLIAEDKRWLHSNLHILKTQVVEHHGKMTGIEAFIADCLDQLGSYERKSAEMDLVLGQDRALTFTKRAIYDYMFKMHTTACVYLAYIHTLPQRQEIVKESNRYLQAGEMQTVKQLEVIKRAIPPEVRTVHALTYILSVATIQCTSETVEKIMSARADLEVATLQKEIKDSPGRSFEPLMCYDDIEYFSAVCSPA